MVRVLQVVSSLNRGSGIMGVIMNIYRHIDHSKIQFDFLYFVKMPISFEEEIKQLGGEIFFIPMLTSCNFFHFRKCCDCFLKEKSNIYKIMHLHEVLLGFVIFPLASKYGIFIRIVHSHNSMPSDRKINAIRNKVLCLSLKLFSTDFIACSYKAGVFLFGKHWMQQGNVTIVNNAVDCNLYKFDVSVRKSKRIELCLEEKFVVGHVGRFCNQKNHMFLVDIFAEVLKRKPNAFLLLIGSGLLQEKIEDKIKSYGIEHSVGLMGTRSDIDELLQAMDVFVLPSLFEGLPVVGVEVQATGLPLIVSSEITEELSLTNNISYMGLNDSPSSWATEIIRLSNKYLRISQKEELRKKGYDISIEALKLQEFYLNRINLTYKNR